MTDGGRHSRLRLVVSRQWSVVTSEASAQRVERGADLRVGRAYGVVAVDAHPRDPPVAVDHIGGRGRDACLPYLRVARVAQAVGVDDLVLGIGEQGKRDATLAVPADALIEGLAVLGGIAADAPQCNRLAGLEQRSELGKLPNAVRSPVAAIEDQHHRPLAALRGEALAAAVLVGEREIRRLLADC